jgi:hypothetical protein
LTEFYEFRAVSFMSFACGTPLRMDLVPEWAELRRALAHLAEPPQDGCAALCVAIVVFWVWWLVQTTPPRQPPRYQMRQGVRKTETWEDEEP